MRRAADWRGSPPPDPCSAVPSVRETIDGRHAMFGKTCGLALGQMLVEGGNLPGTSSGPWR